MESVIIWQVFSKVSRQGCALEGHKRSPLCQLCRLAAKNSPTGLVAYSVLLLLSLYLLDTLVPTITMTQECMITIHCDQALTYVDTVPTGSGNGLLPNGTKPLPETMLTHHQGASVALTYEQFLVAIEISICKMSFKHTHVKLFPHLSEASENPLGMIFSLLNVNFYSQNYYNGQDIYKMQMLI